MDESQQYGNYHEIAALAVEIWIALCRCTVLVTAIFTINGVYGEKSQRFCLQ